MNRKTFAELKSIAKNILSANYWTSFGVCLLYTVIVNAASYLISILTTLPLTFMMTASTISTAAENSMILSSLATSIFTLITMIPITLFLEYPLIIGTTRHFLLSTNGQGNISDLFFAYKNYLGNVVLILFLQMLYIYLWTLLSMLVLAIIAIILGTLFNSPYFALIMLLAIIPMWIKTYQYSMIPYIVAENPAIERKRAFEITKAMTKGNKLRIFLFGLSFIGWILLCLLTLGIGYLFLAPYIYASYTQLYIDLRDNAIAQGSVTEEELRY